MKLVLARPFRAYVYYRFIRHSHLDKSVPHSKATAMVNVLEPSAFILGIMVAVRWLYSAAGSIFLFFM